MTATQAEALCLAPRLWGGFEVRRQGGSVSQKAVAAPASLRVLGRGPRPPGSLGLPASVYLLSGDEGVGQGRREPGAPTSRVRGFYFRSLGDFLLKRYRHFTYVALGNLGLVISEKMARRAWPPGGGVALGRGRAWWPGGDRPAPLTPCAPCEPAWRASCAQPTADSHLRGICLGRSG